MWCCANQGSHLQGNGHTSQPCEQMVSEQQAAYVPGNPDTGTDGGWAGGRPGTQPDISLSPFSLGCIVRGHCFMATNTPVQRQSCLARDHIVATGATQPHLAAVAWPVCIVSFQFMWLLTAETTLSFVNGIKGELMVHERWQELRSWKCVFMLAEYWLV